MNSYFGVFIVLLYLLIMFCSMGYVYDKVFRMNLDKYMKPICGAVVYFFILAMIYIPIQFTNKSLRLFSVMSWGISAWLLLAALVVFGQSTKYRNAEKNISHITCIKNKLKSCSQANTWKDMLWSVLFVCFFIFLVFYTINITFYASGYDSSYYHGIINSTVETGLLNANEPYTGSATSYSMFNQIMFYESFVAVISKMFSIHSLIVINRVVGICEVLAYHYMIFLIARKLLKNSKKAICVMGIVFYINLFMNTIYTSANFLFYRLGEAKSLTANTTIPLLLLFICYIYDDFNNKAYWIVLYMTVIIGLLVNDTAMILIPTTLLTLLLPINLKTRNGKMFIRSTVCFIPCAIFVLLYMM